jgi:hydroxymethylpyrimidine pyrophosphatase-like HAD family hydrolase
VVEALRSAVPKIAFAVEGITRFVHEPGYLPLVRSSDSLIAATEELVAEPVAKILALHPERSPDDLVAEIRELVAGAVEVTHSSTRGLAEISAIGVSKAFALEERACELSIDATAAVASGDMLNELALMAWAGHSVAVANGHADVLAAADEVTTSSDDDGVAVVLERQLAAR